MKTLILQNENCRKDVHFFIIWYVYIYIWLFVFYVIYNKVYGYTEKYQASFTFLCYNNNLGIIYFFKYLYKPVLEHFISLMMVSPLAPQKSISF